MNQKNILLWGIAVAGIGCLILGVYIIFYPSPINNQQSKASNSEMITIPMTDYKSNQWDNRGATVEYKNSAPINVWMANTGSISYNFDLAKLPEKNGNISVLLSSELLIPEEQSSDPTLTSDVILVVNGKEPNGAIQNVIKDTGQNSQRYNWNVPISFFQKGQNSIEFQVKKDAQHPHGVTIWSPITVEFK